ncbi:MAG: hypothetical protein GQ477_01350 [Nanohaloarchaea archaeon]|nr:hypothetical protein [Candidatus Nanohaloarchaea archaeon]
MPQKTDSQMYRDIMLETTEGVLSTAKNVVELTLTNPHVGYRLNIQGEVRQNPGDLSKTITELQNSMELYLLSDKGELIFYEGSTNKVNIASVDLVANSIKFSRPEKMFGFKVLIKEEEGYGHKKIPTEDVIEIYGEVLKEFTEGFKGNIFS